MQRKKTVSLLAIILVLCLLITGCGKAKKLENDSTVVKYKGGKIKADELYQQLREKYGITELLDMMDKAILEKDFKTDEEEKANINSQVEQMKSQYQNDEEAFNAAIKQYLGVDDEDALRAMLSLEYKRNQAIESQVKSTIKDDEIQKYYDDEIVGDMKVRHILIKPETKDDMTEEEQEKAEEKAKKKAEELIKKLDDGADFEKLAKENSDDTGSKDDGGLIDYFNTDSGMDEAFTEASIKLEKGKYTKEPVKSSFGYHIILKVDQKKKKKLKEVKDDILQKLAEEKLTNDTTLRYESLMDYREKKGVEFKDKALKKDYEEYMDNLIETAEQSSNTATQ